MCWGAFLAQLERLTQTEPKPAEKWAALLLPNWHICTQHISSAALSALRAVTLQMPQLYP